MKGYRALFLILALLTVGKAHGQEQQSTNRLDTLIGKGQYATAYIQARENYRQAEEAGGEALLEATFYLTALDYAYSLDANDSALLRYRRLVNILQGDDRAVAYAYLFQTYNSIYREYHYRMRQNKPSDDPNLSCYQWDLRRMEDTLVSCAMRAMEGAGSDMLNMVVHTVFSQPVGVEVTYHDNLHRAFLLPLTEFCQSAVDSANSYTLTLHRRVAELYKEGSPDMMLWLDLQRYKAFHYDSVMIPAIERLARHYEGRIVSDEMKAFLAYCQANYLDMAQRKVEAEKICLETERNHPGTFGARKCQLLREEICSPKFSIRYRNIESSKRSRMACVNSRNVESLSLRLIHKDSVPVDLEDALEDTLMLLPAAMEWRQTLPDPGDHLMHEYLIALPAVPQGDYLLVLTDGTDMCYEAFQSSDADFITYQLPSHSKWPGIKRSSGFLVDRVTGEPLKHKQVTLHTTGKSRRHCRTDKEGYFHFPTLSPLYFFAEIDNLSAEVDGYEYSYGEKWMFNDYYHYDEYDKKLELVMTDRPIYRLGDTVRFCCVAYTRHNRGKGFEIHLRPRSGLKLNAEFGLSPYGGLQDTISLTTDKHGRCWGEFVIPADGKNGVYWLEVYGRGYQVIHRITVEAYKLPHFMVSLSTTPDIPHEGENRNQGELGTVRRFNKPITIYGTAASYSGAPMTGAKVKWEVSCKRMLHPLWDGSMADKFPYSDSLVVDDDGLFQLTFTPKESDLETSTPQSSSTYIYTAHVSVTDADGEMHEERLSFHVSDADGYCLLTGDDISHLSFAYNNFDHEPLKGAVRVEMYQLQQPDTIRTLDPIMEDHPEARWVGSREEFYRHFPFRAFSREEGDRHSWPVVAKRCDQTTEDRKLDIAGLPSGLYRIVFSTPDGGRHDTLMNYVAKGGRVTGDDVVWLRTNCKNIWSYDDMASGLACSVGDTLRLELGSPYGHQPLYFYVAQGAKTLRKGMMILDSSSTTILEIPITKEMANGCRVTLTAMREGCVYDRACSILVAQPDLQLNITAETFRDHLQPGQREAWKFRVTEGGEGKTGVAANLCLTMYDLTLDHVAQSHYPFGFNPWGQHYDEILAYTGYIWSVSVTPNFHFRPQNNIPTQVPWLGPSLPNLSEFYKQMAMKFNPGSIQGTVVDAKSEEPLPFVSVELKKDDHKFNATTTNFDGIFSFDAVPQGNYELEIKSVGYRTLVEKIVVSRDGALLLKVHLSPSSTSLECVEIVTTKHTDVIEIGAPEYSARVSIGDIARMPCGSVEDIVATVAGIGYNDGGTGSSRGEGEMVTMQGNLRQNPSSLAFFEPSLRSDGDGSVSISFTMPDALTQWRLCGFAWSDKYQLGTFEKIVQTQKELMVQPLMPRFLRQGDTTCIRAKVSNLTDSAIHVAVAFEVEGRAVDKEVELTIPAQSSSVATFRLPVKDYRHVAEYKIYARTLTQSGNQAFKHSYDGEQGKLAVLHNRERITLSRLLYVAGTADSSHPNKATNNYSLSSFHHPIDSITISFSANPVDFVVQALPHFKKLRMPGPIYQANSIFTNRLASQLSPLSDKERKKAQRQLNDDLRQLLRDQHSGGGWSWMPHGKTASLFVTESVLQRLAKSRLSADDMQQFGSWLRNATTFLDKELTSRYRQNTQHYPLTTLYTRSLYLDSSPLQECDSITREAYDYYYRLCKMHRRDEMPLYRQAQLALLMYNMDDTADAVELANRIKESAHVDDNLGMYWVSNVSGYDCYERPVETAAILVDLFAAVLHDWQSVNRIQQWILSSKQGTAWNTDMATAAALNALMVHSGLENKNSKLKPTLTINGQPYEEIESGDHSQLSTLNFQLTNPTPFPAWGAVFFSYEAPVDSIPYNGTGISLRKTVSRVDPDGSLHLLHPESSLHLGDRIRVHIDIYCERDMDNMVLTDQRAAAFEPLSTASGWCWNDGLRYYLDVRDDHLDCYIDRLNQGHYYVEYDLLVRHSGSFSNGNAILRSVYAPKFRANSASIELIIED